MVQHYVYVDSRDRLDDEEVTDFRVRLHNPIKNVVRCAVISFSKPNTAYNVHENNNTITWIETTPASSATFPNVNKINTISIPPGYYSVVQLLTLMVQKMNATPGRTNDGEASVTYSYSIDEDYRVSIIASAPSAAANRLWGFYHEPSTFKNSLLHSILNFQRRDILVSKSSISVSNDDVNTWRQAQTSLSATLRTLTASHSYQENQAQLHLCSDTLAQNSQRTSFRNNQTHGTNILQPIPVMVNRWSYIQLHLGESNLLYHSLPNINLDSFDMKLQNEHHQQVIGDAESNYKACILFETLDDEHEDLKIMHREYNAQAYRLAH